MSFLISLNTFEQIKTFVALVAQQPFEVHVGNDRQNINGRHLMSMFTLDYSRPVKVHADCTEAEFAAFQKAVTELV